MYVEIGVGVLKQFRFLVGSWGLQIMEKLRRKISPYDPFTGCSNRLLQVTTMYPIENLIQSLPLS